MGQYFTKALSSSSSKSSCSLSERDLLQSITTVLPYLTLSDIAKLTSLNKEMLQLTTELPYILVYIIKNYYLNTENPHPSITKFFECVLTKRIAINSTNFSRTEQQIAGLALERIHMAENLILNPYMENRSFDGWRIVQNGGDGWNIEEGTPQKNYQYFLSTSHWRCEMGYRAEFLNFPVEFRQKFSREQAVIKAGCWISRKEGYEATGGCRVIMYDENGMAFFMKSCQKESNEISDGTFGEIQVQIAVNEIPNSNRLVNGYIELQIYRNDEKAWTGNSGTQFWGMYMKGDFVNVPLDAICL